MTDPKDTPASRMPQPRHAIITGSASGLGRAIAVRLARDGWWLALADINETANEETLAQVRAAGGEGTCCRLDVTDPAAWLEMRERLQGQWPRLDLLINNAGVGCSGEVGQFSLADWRWAVDVNLLGVIYGCHTMIDWLKQNPSGGRIINVASIAAIASGPAMAPYNVTKAGLLSLSETLYTELRQHNVGVTAVCPGFFPTNLLDGGRYHTAAQRNVAAAFMQNTSLTAERVAEAVVQVIRSRQLYVVVPARARVLWRLKRLMPRTLLKFLGWLYSRQFPKASSTPRGRGG